LRLEIFLFNLFKIVKFEKLKMYEKRIFSLSIIVTKCQFFIVNFTRVKREMMMNHYLLIWDVSPQAREQYKDKQSIQKFNKQAIIQTKKKNAYN